MCHHVDTHLIEPVQRHGYEQQHEHIRLEDSV